MVGGGGGGGEGVASPHPYIQVSYSKRHKNDFIYCKLQSKTESIAVTLLWKTRDWRGP